jgi:hypothetical protein
MRPLLLMLLLLLALPSQAHKVGESYLFVSAVDGKVTGQVQVRLADLERTAALRDQVSVDMSQPQADAVAPALLSYLQRHIAIHANGHALVLDFQPPVVRAIDGLGIYLTVGYNSLPVADAEIPATLELDWSMIFDDVTEHRSLVVVQYSDYSGQTNFANGIAATLDSNHRQATIDLDKTFPWKNFVKFVHSGTEHILFGLDHVLFVIALLVQAVVVRRGGRWVPVDNFRQGLVKLFKVVTLFTLAHSITLSLAVLGVLSLSSRLVESVIAASIAVVALNILIPIFKERIGWMGFAFGLFHGLGFAGNLNYLGLARGSLAIPLAGFNVGVELGQLAIVVLLFPLLYWLSRRDFYIPMVLKPGSGLIAVAALLWLTERMFDINGLLPG